MKVALKIYRECEKYFNIDDIKIGFSGSASADKVTLAVLKVLSYCTVIIPLGVGLVYALAGRVGFPPKDAKKVSDVAKKHFYIIGAGIAGLNTALLLMRKGVSGKQITLLEENQECGGLFYRNVSADGKHFYAHTVRTFDEPSYQYTEEAWKQAGIWNRDHLVNRNFDHPRQTIPSEMRQVFLSIISKTDEELSNLSIADLIPEKIRKGPTFRYFFHLTGLFDHHNALSLKRYMTHTHGNIPHNWVLRSAACDYDSIVDPIVSYLTQEGVTIETGKAVKKLHIKNHHVLAIDDRKLGPDDKVIATVGANVGSELFPEGTLLYDTTHPISPDTPLETSKKQPHGSVWVLAHQDLASKIEALFPGSKDRDYIHIDVDHPWQITFISLGNQYYKQQPKDHRLFYISTTDLSKKGLHVDRKGADCTESQQVEEVLKRLKIWDIVQKDPSGYTATVDPRARQFKDRDATPIARYMPGEAQRALVFPDTQCDNLAVIGERVRAYEAPVPTTEWVTETGHRAIEYLLEGERHRMTLDEYRGQERKFSFRFVWNWIKYKLHLGGPNFKSSVAQGLKKP